jgi:outer membrane protein OmpA-like peptidoglycan-associated protein
MGLVKYFLNYRHIYVAIAAYFICQITLAQNNNCSVSRVVRIPFVKDTGRLVGVEGQLIKQKTTYGASDQFSYWYKLEADDETFINCQITPINKKDQYIVYIYKYKQNDFCEKVHSGKIKPVRVENEKSKRSIIEASEASDFTFKAKKGDVFYFSILNVSTENCGHILRLVTGSDTLKLTAENACNPADKPKDAIVKIKELFDSKPTYDTILLAVRETNKELKQLIANIKITDDNSQKRIKIDSSVALKPKVIIERNKNYTVECNVTGYKKFLHSMNIHEYVNPFNNTFTIYVKPLKAGDNFVMENIYFHTNTYALKDESLDALKGLLNYMLENPDVKIELQGHTNGNNKLKASKSNKNKEPQWNFSGTAKKLSLLRAEEIKSYLVTNGVNKNNIKTVGFGGDKMIVTNLKSPEALKKNARVEVVIVEDGGL